ncbi:hypothetical protein CROQUDRAFT_96495 [Cronartium quercuum f. sp. fusiforme G11]|uniref:Uncharacterized protein n=1 Tax=Cronartium quercuum f. sp. fusiforme G11 TaxID=708437 RepID=A0A9P6NBY3_9BASI|nr:hypothetical protein CROQUDRAFT_96495 [Cronartium quercuum f. sp. fusiforme G11]
MLSWICRALLSIQDLWHLDAFSLVNDQSTNLGPKQPSRGSSGVSKIQKVVVATRPFELKAKTVIVSTPLYPSSNQPTTSSLPPMPPKRPPDNNANADNPQKSIKEKHGPRTNGFGKSTVWKKVLTVVVNLEERPVHRYASPDRHHNDDYVHGDH